MNQRQPNIVLILVDDMGYSDLGCYGSTIKTPQLDELADNGVRFTDFYTTPRCCPSRASLLTGLTPHKAGVGWMTFDWKAYFDPEADGYTGTLSQDAVTIAEALKPAGYRTYMSGKWHVTAELDNKNTWPLARGFDEAFACILGMDDYFHPEFFTRDSRFYEAPEACYTTDLIGDNAARCVEKHCQEHPGDPFFLYLAFTAPHFPLQAPEERIRAYESIFDHGYEEEQRQRFERMKAIGIVKPDWIPAPLPEGVPAWESLSDEQKAEQIEIMQTYAAMVEIMDENVGKVVSSLKASGEFENTVIFFLSDNGACAEAGPLSHSTMIGENWAWAQNSPFRLYKHFTMQGGVQSPLIVHWPDGIQRPPGSLVEQSTASLYDIMPTCLELAGTESPQEYQGCALQPLDGESLVPVFSGGEMNDSREIYIEHEGNGMLRRGRYKVVHQFGEPWQLYDMQDDRTESRNLVSCKEHLETFLEMTKRFETWAANSKVEPWERISVAERYRAFGNVDSKGYFRQLRRAAPSKDIVRDDSV